MNPTFVITPRDLEVLNLLRLGYSNKEVAQELGISSQTVRNHIRIMGLRAQVPSLHVRIHLLNLLDGKEIDEKRIADLKTRDQEIVRLICEGQTNLVIAQKVGISTVQVLKNELRRIFDITGVFSRFELRRKYVLDRQVA